MLEKPGEIKKCFPGKVTSKPRLEEEKIAQAWKRGEYISDMWEGGHAHRGPERKEWVRQNVAETWSVQGRSHTWCWVTRIGSHD